MCWRNHAPQTYPKGRIVVNGYLKSMNCIKINVAEFKKDYHETIIK
jgi:hypothetical protein